jgi:hypothetical protein
MDAEDSKAMDEIIRKTYYSKDGSKIAYKLWLDVKAVDTGITLDWVRGWLRRNIDPKGQVGGARNSYVAPHAYHEYQVDFTFITKRQFAKQKIRAGMSMIDVFTKFAVVVSIKKRLAAHIVPALFKGFEMMGRQPEILYSDDEPALRSKLAIDALAEANIQHIVAGSGHFVERFNRTFKNLMTARLNALMKPKRVIGKQPQVDPTSYQWTDLIPHVMAEYNGKNKHRVIGMTPTEAKKPSSQVDVKTAMELVARRGRRFPTLSVGDVVRVLKKKNPVGEKEWMDNFKPGEHTITSISENVGQKFYTLSNGKELIRSDIVRMKS